MNSRETFKCFSSILIVCYKFLPLTNLQKCIIFYNCEKGPFGFVEMQATLVVCLSELELYETFLPQATPY